MGKRALAALALCLASPGAAIDNGFGWDAPPAPPVEPVSHQAGPRAARASGCLRVFGSICGKGRSRAMPIHIEIRHEKKKTGAIHSITLK